MATFAIVSGNTVTNVIVANSKEDTEQALDCVLVEYTPENPAGIGWIYDPTTGIFTDPRVVENTDGL